MDNSQGEPKRYVRRVVSRLETIVCESPTRRKLYGESTKAAADIAKLFGPLIVDEPVEHFITVMLDVQNKIIAYDETSKGTLTSSLVHPREVFGPAIRFGAASVIVAHNHPSGDPKPSLADGEVTKRLLEAGKLLGIPLLDHVVLGACGSYRSLREVMEFS